MQSNLINVRNFEIHPALGVVCKLAMFEDQEDSSYPFPQELRNACIQRKSSFQAGRELASLAISSILDTKYVYSVGMNKDRSPNWPDGIVGSISHSQNHVIVSVADGSQFLSLGVDVEMKMTDRISQMCTSTIFVEGEQNLYKNSWLGFEEFVTLVFSAKESIFKAIYPIVGFYFDFDAVRLLGLDKDLKTMKFSIVNPDLVSQLHADFLEVKFSIEEDVFITSADIPNNLN